MIDTDRLTENQKQAIHTIMTYQGKTYTQAMRQVCGKIKGGHYDKVQTTGKQKETRASAETKISA